MSAIVYQTNKSTGTTYAYKSLSYLGKKMKQFRAKRKCIGKADPVTGDIVPTRKQKVKTIETEAMPKPGPASTTESARLFMDPLICSIRLVKSLVSMLN